MAKKSNPFAKKAPPFGKKGPSEPDADDAKKGKNPFFKKGGKVKK